MLPVTHNIFSRHQLNSWHDVSPPINTYSSYTLYFINTMIAVNNDYFNVLYIILVLERCHGGCTAAMNRENTCIFTFSFSAELEHVSYGWEPL